MGKGKKLFSGESLIAMAPNRLDSRLRGNDGNALAGAEK